MRNTNRLLLASVALALVSGPQAFAAPPVSRPILMAQAAEKVPEAVVAAAAKVKAAREALQQAMAGGKGVREARQALRAALKELNDTRVAAGLPPINEPPEGKAEAPPATDQQPPAAAEAPPPADQQQPPAEAAKAPPPPEAAPAPAAEAPKRKPKPPTDEAKAPPPPPEAAPTPAAEAPKRKPKPPTDEAKAPPPEAAPAPAAEAPKRRPKPPADEAKAPPPPVEAPAEQAKSAAPANPPPPAMANGAPPKFDPALLKKPHPRFGDTPKGDTAAPLPKQEAQIPKGGEINAGAGRTIVRDDSGQVTVRHDDTERFRQLGGNVAVQQGPGGTTTTVVNRPGGVQVVTVRDRSGNILQRYRKDRNGQIEVLIGQAEPRRDGRKAPPPPPKAPAPTASFDFHVQLPPLKLNIPRNQYIVESSRASRRELTQAFSAPPVERVERAYSLEEIRRSDRIRNKVRRVDFDTVTFEFGSAVLPDDEIPQMQAVGEAMRAVIDQHPDQVFLVEGHTDAVGSDLANLALSDRRAQTVAEILTYYFGIPPENLVTQGYGEEFLKVPTTAPERENRRVAFRNITPLMRSGNR